MNPDHLLLGFSLATTPVNLLFAFLGVLLGTILGALPGIGPSAGVACCCHASACRRSPP